MRKRLDWPMFIKVAGGKTSFSYALDIYRLLSVRIPKPIEPVGILLQEKGPVTTHKRIGHNYQNHLNSLNI